MVRIVGHGTSDNAATYGVYAFGLLCGSTALRDSISLTVYYDASIDLSGSAVLALSQSGETPDVVEYVERARARGALTIAITNDERSTLAEAAELMLPLHAGVEHAVAATKTYMSSLAVIALLAGHTAVDGARTADDLRRYRPKSWKRRSASFFPTPDRDDRVSSFEFLGRMFVIGRGLELATAREIALKLQETCRVAADALTATDFAHCPPVNAVDALCSRCGRSRRRTPGCPAASRPRQASATRVRAHSTGAPAARSHRRRRLPASLPPHRQRSRRSTRRWSRSCRASCSRGRWRWSKGYDPDRPDRLTKVTLAR